MIHVCRSRRWPVQEKANVCCNQWTTNWNSVKWVQAHCVAYVARMVTSRFGCCVLPAEFSYYYKVAWLLKLVHHLLRCLTYIDFKSSKSDDCHSIGKKRGNSHDCLFLGLVLQCFGRTFSFLSSFLFVYLIVLLFMSTSLVFEEHRLFFYICTLAHVIHFPTDTNTVYYAAGQKHQS